MEKYSNGHDIVEAALELRMSEHAKAFRNELNELEKAWESGDIDTIDWYFYNIEQIVVKFSEQIKVKRKISLTLSLTPSIGVDIDVPKTKKYQCLFLKDLAQFGVKERPPKLMPNSRLFGYR